MRCDIHTSRSTTKNGKCQRIFCAEKRQPGCAILKHGKRLLGKLKIVRAEQVKLEEELVA